MAPEAARPPLRLPWRRLGLGLAVALSGVALWPLLGGAADATFRAVANETVGDLTFGSGGHVAFHPAAAHLVTTAGDDASWSTQVERRIDGVEPRNRIRINARRLLYLPCVILAAIVLASALPPRRKAVALGIGGAILMFAALASSWLLSAWLFARVPGLVYDLSSFEARALGFGYEAWATALGNRFVAPVFVGAALVLLLSRRGPETRAAAATLPASWKTNVRRSKDHRASRPRPRRAVAKASRPARR